MHVSSSETALAAELKAPDFKVEIVSAKGGKGQSVRASAPKGHHFNLQAPKSLEAAGQKSKARAESTEQTLWFDAPKAKEFTVRAYLCDDKKTFCEEHVVKATAGASPSALKTEPLKPTASKKSEARAQGATYDPHGFIVNEAEAALARAKEERKPLVIDFFGIWCPPCNELDEHVFSAPEFKQSSSRFVLLKLDADSDASWELKSRYKVGGYPTVVFASPDGEELSRVVGFRAKDLFLLEMEKAWASRELSTQSLVASAEKGDVAASFKLGRMYLERRQFDEAILYLEKSGMSAEELLAAKIGQIEALEKQDPAAFEAKRAALVALYEKILHGFPQSPDSVPRRLSLADLYEKQSQGDKRKTVLVEAVKRAEELARNPVRLRGFDYSAADMWSLSAEAQEQLGNASAAKAAWKGAVAEYRKAMRSEHERGYSLELAYALWKTDDKTAAEKIYVEMEKRYPREFTFYNAHARMKLRDKELSAARLLAQKAVDFSYGDNHIRAVQLLAEVLVASGDRPAAKALIEKELTKVRLPVDTTIRTHGYVKSLKKLGKEVGLSVTDT